VLYLLYSLKLAWYYQVFAVLALSSFSYVDHILNLHNRSIQRSERESNIDSPAMVDPVIFFYVCVLVCPLV
jgi:hypothetical protein